MVVPVGAGSTDGISEIRGMAETEFVDDDTSTTDVDVEGFPLSLIVDATDVVTLVPEASISVLVSVKLGIVVLLPTVPVGVPSESELASVVEVRIGALDDWSFAELEAPKP